MVNREVRELLLRKLGSISPQALSQRANKFKNRYGPMTTEEAVYVIAHQNGIDLSRYLQIGVMDKIRTLVPRELPAAPSVPKKEMKKKIQKKKTTPSYPLVSSTLISYGFKIGENAFPNMFILENSIRSLITKIMSKSKGQNWWDTVLSAKRRKIIQWRIDKEKEYPHRRKRGTHPIFYSDFSDLKDIILGNQDLFKAIILDFNWFDVKMDEVYMARNSLAHNVRIDNDDVSRINLFYREWANVLANSGY